MDGDNNIEDIMNYSNISDSDIIKQCEQEWEASGSRRSLGKHAYSISEKRMREKSDESSEDGFITVIRHKPKRLVRSDSQDKIIQEQEMIDLQSNSEICITSKEILPKSMALAKLFSEENLQGINRIKYKSPYKVLVQFEKREYAEKLLNCKKMDELGFRTQLTNELSMVYGLVKGVDLELDDKQIIELLNCSCDIISVKRLNRIDEEGKWSPSESVRVCFRTTHLPEFVYAYGCRFKVEPYIFPVSQCSGCWKYGHIKTFCPSKKILCPKCGDAHANCETSVYKCLNCGGPHMALNKECRIFKKEKEIREIMSLKSITYRKALEHYLKEKSNLMPPVTYEIEEEENTTVELNRFSSLNNEMTYSSVVARKKADNHTIYNKREEECEVSNNGKQSNKKKNKRCTNQVQQFDREEMEVVAEEFSDSSEPVVTKKKERSFEFKVFIERIKNILTSKKSLEEKVIDFIKYVVEELKVFIKNLINKADILSKVINIFNG